MMYLLTLLMAASGCCNVLEENTARVAPEGAPTLSPTIIQSVSLDDAVYLEWSSVATTDNKPIGYKVLVREVKGVTNYHFEAAENGSHVLVHDVKQPNKFSYDPSVTPDHAIKSAIDVGNANSVTLRKIKEGVWYEFRVFAYNEKGEGPMSNPLRYRIPRESSNQTEESAKNKYEVS